MPGRSHSLNVFNSVERDGVQQPIIVRPHPTKIDEYEIVDGHARWASVKKEQKVLLDIRIKLSDSDVFRIAESTFKRTPRSTYKRAEFTAKFVEAIKRGGAMAPQAEVAKKLGVTEGQISQYVAIYKIFKSLESVAGEDQDFNALKKLSVNKLYELTKLKIKASLLKAAEEIEQCKGQLLLAEVKRIVSAQKDEEFFMTPEEKEAANKTPTRRGLSQTEYCQKSAKTIERLMKKLNEDLAPLIRDIKEKHLVSAGIYLTMRGVIGNLKKATGAIEHLDGHATMGKRMHQED